MEVDPSSPGRRPDSAAGAGTRDASEHSAGGTPGRAHRVEVTVTSATGVAPHKASAGKLYLMRDGGDPEGPVLAFTAAEWEAFVLGVRDGEFDSL